MNAKTNAFRSGIARGWHETVLSFKSPQDWGFYLFISLGVLLYLWLNRNNELEGTSMTLPTFALPSILGGLIVFGLVIGPGYAIAMEREDGTLLRFKSTPHGMAGYVTGQIVLNSFGIIPMFIVILVPSLFLFDGLMQNGLAGWATVVWVTVLGLLATLPFGIILGSLVPNVQKMGTWGFFPIMILAGISGIFFPIQALWGWIQVVAQIFPMYWLGLGMRSAFLPDSAAMLEIGDSWRTAQTVVILSLWAIAGFLIAPVVLRRMAKRQSGSQVEAARHEATQWVR